MEDFCAYASVWQKTASTLPNTILYTPLPSIKLSNSSFSKLHAIPRTNSKSFCNSVKAMTAEGRDSLDHLQRATQHQFRPMKQTSQPSPSGNFFVLFLLSYFISNLLFRAEFFVKMGLTRKWGKRYNFCFVLLVVSESLLCLFSINKQITNKFLYSFTKSCIQDWWTNSKQQEQCNKWWTQWRDWWRIQWLTVEFGLHNMWGKEMGTTEGDHLEQ